MHTMRRSLSFCISISHGSIKILCCLHIKTENYTSRPIQSLSQQFVFLGFIHEGCLIRQRIVGNNLNIFCQVYMDGASRIRIFNLNQNGDNCIILSVDFCDSHIGAAGVQCISIKSAGIIIKLVFPARNAENSLADRNRQTTLADVVIGGGMREIAKQDICDFLRRRAFRFVSRIVRVSRIHCCVHSCHINVAENIIRSSYFLNIFFVFGNSGIQIFALNEQILYFIQLCCRFVQSLCQL